MSYFPEGLLYSKSSIVSLFSSREDI